MTSNFTNLSSFTDLFDAGNTVSDGWLMPGFVVTVFSAIFLFSLPMAGTSRSLMYSSFITGIIILLLNIQGYMDYWVLVADLMLFTVGAFFAMRER